MTKHLLAASSIFLGCTLISFTISAEDKTDSSTDTSSNSTIEISKDSWLKSVTPLLPNLICKGFENDSQLKNDLMKSK